MPQNTIEEIEGLPGSLPGDTIPTSLTAPPSACLDFVKAALPSLASNHVTKDLLWRDLLALSGSTHTFSGSERILPLWNRLVGQKVSSGQFAPRDARIVRHLPAQSWIDVPFTFLARSTKGADAVCSGAASLIPDGDSWKIWMITTLVEQLHGALNPNKPISPDSIAHSRKGDKLEPSTSVDVAIVGAGHCGLSAAGRLRAVGLDCLVLDKGDELGSSWTQDKYDSVRMHTIKESSHLPFDRTYDAEQPDYLTGSDVSQGLRRFAEQYVPKLWLSATVGRCSWDPQTGKWTVPVQRAAHSCVVHASHLIIAIGASTVAPFVPDIPGTSLFKGELLHTASYKNSAAWAGRRALVVGSGTSAHDVADDMVQARAASVTMVQRDKTAIFPIEWVGQGYAAIYNRQIPTDLADRANALPLSIARQIVQAPMKLLTLKYPQLFDSLEKAGFHVDKRPGLLDLTVMRAGGYYIDVGTSSRIAKGEINVKSRVGIERFTADSVVFTDGTELPVEVVVFATGFDHDPGRFIAPLVEPDISSQVTKAGFWNINAEGEQKGSMGPVAKNLWLMAGGPMHARWFSKFIALRIQADLQGDGFEDDV